jgi:S-adenosylmethionine:tRNA ribosyltransferase-isomerase
MIGRDELMRIYTEAIRERYRFFSFGDGMCIL